MLPIIPKITFVNSNKDYSKKINIKCNLITIIIIPINNNPKFNLIIQGKNFFHGLQFMLQLLI